VFFHFSVKQSEKFRFCSFDFRRRGRLIAPHGVAPERMPKADATTGLAPKKMSRNHLLQTMDHPSAGSHASSGELRPGRRQAYHCQVKSSGLDRRAGECTVRPIAAAEEFVPRYISLLTVFLGRDTFHSGLPSE
jgi:hypothetical protein